MAAKLLDLGLLQQYSIGKTPLMVAVNWDENLDRDKLLLRAGASTDMITPLGETVISEIVSITRFCDQTNVQKLAFIINYNPALDKDSPSRHSRLVDITSTEALVRAAFRGRGMTVEFCSSTA